VVRRLLTEERAPQFLAGTRDEKDYMIVFRYRFEKLARLAALDAAALQKPEEPPPTLREAAAKVVASAPVHNWFSDDGETIHHCGCHFCGAIAALDAARKE
jgi:hypothetical protein